MDDKKITELLYSNDESGLAEISKKYGSLIGRICGAVLHSREDAEECSNDTLMAVWKSIPPNKPENLAGYICKVARRKAVSRVRYNTAAVRSGDLLTELDECIASDYSIEDEAEKAELSEQLNKWLYALPEKQRMLFVKRYYYFQSVKRAARECGMSETAASTALARLRGSLKEYLIEGGMFDDTIKSDNRGA